MLFRGPAFPFCALALTLAACGEPAPNGPPAGTGGTPGSGGSTSGGATQGGMTSSSGGSANGGTTLTSGGATSGGATTSSGGSANGGSTPTGGTNAGGAGGAGGASAGSSSGGVGTTGGAASGGSASQNGGAAGTSTGGSSSGGANTGGASKGGANTGGSSGAGGASGGQTASGGSAGTTGVYHPCPTNGSPCKIMPFGDSITDGYGIAGGYRVELFRLAHQAGKNITFVGTGSNGPGMVDGVAFPPNHEGHSGYTIAPAGGRQGISPLVATVMPQFTPHIVTLMIGTNDCIDSYELSTAPARLGALIDSIYAQLPNVLIVVAQPIPSQDDALNTRLQTYNAAIPAVVKARADAGKHILLVDLYSPFTANAQYKSALLMDTWHPNQAGHVILGARWYAALSTSL